MLTIVEKVTVLLCF